MCSISNLPIARSQAKFPSCRLKLRHNGRRESNTGRTIVLLISFLYFCEWLPSFPSTIDDVVTWRSSPRQSTHAWAWPSRTVTIGTGLLVRELPVTVDAVTGAHAIGERVGEVTAGSYSNVSCRSARDRNCDIFFLNNSRGPEIQTTATRL
jgi:hypothetical protein